MTAQHAPTSAGQRRTLPTFNCLRLSSWRRSAHRASPVVPRAAGTCTVYDLHDQQVPYKQAWEWQKQAVAEAVEAAGTPGAPGRDSLFILQHRPVYTLGTGSTEDHLKFDPRAPPIPLYRTERGGEVTYHGPGQLVLYPILDLSRGGRAPDLHAYLRNLEEVAIRALRSASGLDAGRVEGLTGVWVGGAKVAAIGVRARRWVTFHGLALNVTADLTPFRSIVPCGIADKPVTSVVQLLEDRRRASAAAGPSSGYVSASATSVIDAASGRTGRASGSVVAGAAASRSVAAATMATAAPKVGGDAAAAALGLNSLLKMHDHDENVLRQYNRALQESFADVFGVELVAGDCSRWTTLQSAP